MLITPTQQEIEQRIALDFQLSINDILPQLQKYYPKVDSLQIAEWEDSKALEFKIIDGEKRYFNNAVANLMRIDSSSRQMKTELEGTERAGRSYIIKKHIQEVITQKDKSPKKNLFEPHNWHFFHRIYVTPTTQIENGMLLRAWLPAPNSTITRQQDIKLIYSNIESKLNLAQPHSVCYMEQIYDSMTINKFEVKYQFTTYAEYHQLPQNFKHKKSDPTDKEISKYLQQKAPHCQFSDNIRELSNKIIGNETRPYFQARLLFVAMRTLYPWASAREYSTIDNIPEYVITNHHGDCGQITLLYITLCRYLGIPARWQSGFMLHPGYENLHDWAEIYIEGMGWIPVDASFGVQTWGTTDEEKYFYFGGMDAFRMIVNTNWGATLSPNKLFERSETVDFQRGECETKKNNLYFNKWNYEFKVENR